MRFKPTTVAGAILAWTGLFVCSVSPAALFHAAEYNWQTLATDHFRIHFHGDHRDIAQHVANIAEAVHPRLTRAFNWSPNGKTEVVLSDESDLANGQADVVPYNQMELFISPPAFFPDIKDYADWLESVFVHEYIHIIHMDKADQFPESLRTLFGRMPLLFPNRMQPLWLIEGIATFYETDKGRGIGRGQGSYFDMVMRMEVKKGVLALNKVNQVMSSWPSGLVPYLYGVHFYQFLEQSQDKEAIHRFIHAYSGKLIPYFLNSNAKRALGKDFRQLWKDFEDYLTQKYNPQLEAVEQQGELAGQRLTHGNYRRLVLSGDRRGRVYMIGEDGKQQPYLASVDEPDKQMAINGGSHIHVHADAGILLSQPDFYLSNRLYYDLYRVDPADWAIKRLTRNARYIQACWLHDGQRILAVKTENGRSALHLLDANGELLQQLWQGDFEHTIASLDCSPKAPMAVASTFEPGKGWNIALFNTEKKLWRPLTRYRAVEENPVFSADGQSILFSAAIDGIYNIYRRSVTGPQLEILTRVFGGAFYPAQNHAHVMYAGYHGDGFDVYQLPVQAQTLDQEVAEGPSGKSSAPWSPVDTRLESYEPWSRLVPSWWFPVFEFSNHRSLFGINTSARDPLQRHTYDIVAAYDSENEIEDVYVNYLYDRWNIMWLAGVTRENDLFIEDDQLLAIRQTDEIQLSALLPLLHINQSWSWQLAAITSKSRDVFVDPRAGTIGDFNDGIVAAGINYDSSRRFPLSVSRTAGRSIMLTWESHDVLDSDFEGNAYLINWREYINLTANHVLGIQLNGGYTDPDGRRFLLGGVDGAPLSGVLAGLNVNGRFYQRDFPLRGYSNTLAALFGNHMASGTLEWRMLLARPERGWMAPPVSLQNLSASLFVDSGDAWLDGQSFEAHTGVGAEINLDTRIFYTFPIFLRLGYAQGLEDIGEEQWYVRFGTSF